MSGNIKPGKQERNGNYEEKKDDYSNSGNSLSNETKSSLNNLNEIKIARNYSTIMTKEAKRKITKTWLFTVQLTKMSVESRQYRKQLDKIFISWRELFSALEKVWLTVPSLAKNNMITSDESNELDRNFKNLYTDMNHKFQDQLYWLVYNGANDRDILQKSINKNIAPYFNRVSRNNSSQYNDIKSQRLIWQQNLDSIIKNFASTPTIVNKFFKKWRNIFLQTINDYNKTKHFVTKMKMNKFNKRFQNRLKVFITKKQLEEQFLLGKIQQLFDVDNLPPLSTPIINKLKQSTRETLNAIYNKSTKRRGNNKVKGVDSIVAINKSREQLLTKGIEIDDIQAMTKNLLQIVDNLKDSWGENKTPSKSEVMNRVKQLKQLLSTFEELSPLYPVRLAIDCLIDRIIFTHKLSEEVLIQRTKMGIKNTTSDLNLIEELDLTNRNSQKLFIKHVLHLLLKGQLKEKGMRDKVIFKISTLLEDIEEEKTEDKALKADILKEIKKWGSNSRGSDPVFIRLLIDAGKFTSYFAHSRWKSSSVTEDWLRSAAIITHNEIEANKRTNQPSKETKDIINKLNNKYQNNSQIDIIKRHKPKKKLKNLKKNSIVIDKSCHNNNIKPVLHSDNLNHPKMLAKETKSEVKNNNCVEYKQNIEFFRTKLNTIKNDWISTKIGVKEASTRLIKLEHEFRDKYSSNSKLTITAIDAAFYHHFATRINFVLDMQSAETTYKKKSTTKVFEQLQSYEAIVEQLLDINITKQRKRLLKKQLKQLKSTDHLVEIDMHGQKAIMTYLCKCIISGFLNNENYFDQMIFLLSKLLYSRNIFKIENKPQNWEDKCVRINKYLDKIRKACGYNKDHNKVRDVNEEQLLRVLAEIAMATSGVLKGIIELEWRTQTWSRLVDAVDIAQKKPSDYIICKENLNNNNNITINKTKSNKKPRKNRDRSKSETNLDTISNNNDTIINNNANIEYKSTNDLKKNRGRSKSETKLGTILNNSATIINNNASSLFNNQVIIDRERAVAIRVSWKNNKNVKNNQEESSKTGKLVQRNNSF